jgi:dihydrofolate synthase/folylpolyglutamate synthase
VSEDTGGVERGEVQMSYREALDWLYALQIYGIKLGLEAMGRLCAELGVDLQSGETRKFVHVAGTNGKGSVCALIASMCCAIGKRTGLYTSPHLVTFRERIRLGPHQIPEAHVAGILSEIRELTAQWPHQPTFFEVATALALAWFQRQRAEWIILETGLGGRLDATNVVTPVVSVLTPISFDHTQHLGKTLAAIAAEKAGIIKRGVPVISAPQAPEVEDVFRRAAAELGCSINFINNPIAEKWPLALPGSHQRINAAVAFAALVATGLRPDPKAIGQAMSDVRWPGRFQRVQDDRVVLDGAHNPAAAAQLAETWCEQFGPDDRPTVILGVLADKDVAGVCAPLGKLAKRIVCVPVRSPRALPPSELEKVVRSTTDVPCEFAESLSAALERVQAHPDRILIAGSLFLVGEALVTLGLTDAPQEWSAQ